MDQRKIENEKFTTIITSRVNVDCNLFGNIGIFIINSRKGIGVKKRIESINKFLEDFINDKVVKDADSDDTLLVYLHIPEPREDIMDALDHFNEDMNEYNNDKRAVEECGFVRCSDLFFTDKDMYIKEAFIYACNDIGEKVLNVCWQRDQYVKDKRYIDDLKQHNLI